MLKKASVSLWIVAGAVIAAAAVPAVAASKSDLASATLLAADGSVKGEVRMTERRGVVQVKVSASGLTPGQHGVHLHTIGSCNAPDFTSAGPHLNPMGKMHGSQNPQGPHLGDLPNLNAGGGGKASFTATLPGTLADLGPQLFDGDGTALVVHAGVDDYMTDPSGNSGGRVLCGVLQRRR